MGILWIHEDWHPGLVPAFSCRRDYVTPELPSDKTYTYKVKVRWTQDGQPVEREREIKVRRNETTTADFNSLPPTKG